MKTIQLFLTMNHTGWFETRRQMIFLVIFAEEFFLNSIAVSIFLQEDIYISKIKSQVSLRYFVIIFV